MQEVSAAAADPERARLVQTLIGAPLLRVTRLHFDTAGRPVLHLTVYL